MENLKKVLLMLCISFKPKFVKEENIFFIQKLGKAPSVWSSSKTSKIIADENRSS
jgi:hypothetical protein